MDDDNITQFVVFTGASVDKARQYLNISDNNLEQAVELFFSTGGVDLIDHSQAPAPAPASNEPPPVPPRHTRSIDSDDDVIDLDSDKETENAGNRPIPSAAAGARTQPSAAQESDEAMARRLQEEMYGEAGMGGQGRAGFNEVDADGYRAPIARTRETLVGPDSYDLTNEDDMRAAVLEQMQQRAFMRQNPSRSSRPGIFNQQDSIWDSDGERSMTPSDRQARLARATGGASTTSNKSTLLAEMYSPPFDLMSKLSWEDARGEGKDGLKWVLVNVQDPSIFDCQVLNRDLWKHTGIVETIREHFIFMQYSKDDARGNQYMQYYFQNKDSQDAYPHIAIVDPRTGEQVKVWSGPPTPKASEFLMQLHEFLDRYSLDVTAKNPVAKRKTETNSQKKGVDSMTEEEQLEMAMQASLAGGHGQSTGADVANMDPDALTRSFGDVSWAPGAAGPSIEQLAHRSSLASPSRNGTSAAEPTPPPGYEAVTSPPPAGPPEPDSPFASISSSNPHVEPVANVPGTTRIQFRHPEGRIVRRFALQEPVRRLYEWLKAEPLEGKEGRAFDLVAMGTNLIEKLEESVEEAGLKNGTVMVEFLESD